MAVLDVTEYSTLAVDAPGRVIAAGQEPSVVHQQVAISGTSAQSAAFQDATKFIRLHTDTACRILVGVNPTAATTSMRLPANGTEYLGVRPGFKVAVISTT